MASRQHVLQHTKPRYESPAKVFAKLKSKVQREAMCANEPLCNVAERRGAAFYSPRKRPESFWTYDEPKENQRFGSYRDDVKVLTLSPISTPKKTFGYQCSYTKKPVEEIPAAAEMGHVFLSRNGHTPTKRAPLESTAVSHPQSPVNREQIPAEPPLIRNLDRFNVASRTPVKKQPVASDSVRGAFDEDHAPLDRQMSPAKVFSPPRKRKWEQEGMNKVSSSSSSTKEVNTEVISQPQERKTSTAFSEDSGDVRWFPAERSETNQLTHRPALPPLRAAIEKRCLVVLEKIPLMSPAKMFAYMKERESKREQQNFHEVSSSIREVLNGGNNLHQSRDTSVSTPHNKAEIEDTGLRDVAETVVPVSDDRTESADSQSDLSEDVPSPAAPSKPLLLEDPLVLNSPQISIPKKKHQAVFKQNQWPQHKKFPNEKVIYLKDWFLRKNHKGLFVDGIHREDNIPWNSNIIMSRVSNYVLKTVSGRVYILVGKMNLDVDSGFPSWFLKKFANGFPQNWKALYEKFLSESRDDPRGEKKRTIEGSAVRARTKSEASSPDVSVKQQSQKPFKTSDFCPLASSTKVSRSGRLIKPPLEYWKGGRVILDAHMNVTIHECYDTSICIPEVSTTVSSRESQVPARVFLPCREGRKQSESASNEEMPVPIRKVKAPLRKHNRIKVNQDEKPSNPPEPPVDTDSSPEVGSRRSRKRCQAMEKMLYGDTVPPKQKEPQKATTQRSKKQIHDAYRPSGRGRRKTVSSPESSIVNDKALQQESSDEFSIKKKKQQKRPYRKKGRKVIDKLQPSSVSPSSQSSASTEESEVELKRRNRVTKNSYAVQTRSKHKQRKSTKISPFTKPLPRSTQSNKTHMANIGSTIIPQEHDKDEWTEGELMRLQEAVSYYPRHIAGYWVKVAKMVGTRSAEECHNQHTFKGSLQTPAKRAKIPRKEKVEAPKDPVTDHPVISARVGTLKRKQQVRQFLEAMPRADTDDVFCSAYMQNKRTEIPSMCLSEDHDFAMSELEPLTPMSKVFPEVKTPQCLHITPSMIGSPNRNNDDKYVYQLQKRMKKNQFNVCKQARSSKSFTPEPSAKRTMKRCGNTENNTFVVWEMFPGNNGAPIESDEEEDYYFTDSD